MALCVDNLGCFYLVIVGCLQEHNGKIVLKKALL